MRNPLKHESNVAFQNRQWKLGIMKSSQLVEPLALILVLQFKRIPNKMCYSQPQTENSYESIDMSTNLFIFYWPVGIYWDTEIYVVQ